MFIPKSDISASGEDKAAGKVLRDKVAAVLSKKKATTWKTPDMAESWQAMPDHISHLISIVLLHTDSSSQKVSPNFSLYDMQRN